MSCKTVSALSLIVIDYSRPLRDKFAPNGLVLFDNVVTAAAISLLITTAIYPGIFHHLAVILRAN